MHFGRVCFQVGIEASPVLPRTAVVDRGGVKGFFVVDRDRELRIGLDPERLQAFGSSAQGARTLIKMTNISLPAGDFIDKNRNSSVFVEAQLKRGSDVRSLVVAAIWTGPFILRVLPK